MIALVAPMTFWDLDEMLQAIAPLRDDVEAQKPLLLALDRIEDPHNYGAILRSALAAGVAGVIVPMKHMAPLNEAAIKTSAGTALRQKIARVHNLPRSLYQMKERGYWIVGADQNGPLSMDAFEWNRPAVIVVGSEAGGLESGVVDQCDAIVSIPMYGPVESLNVSVATALLVFAAASSRANKE